MNPALCANGHDRIDNERRNDAGHRICRKCVAEANRRHRLRRRNKYTVVEPEADYVPATRVPEHRSILAHGYWQRIVRRVLLLSEGEAIRVPLDELTLTGSGNNAVMTAARKIGARVEVRVAVDGLYVIQRASGKGGAA